MNRQARDSGKITFRCTSCGARLTVCEALAGKRGRCPKCKQMVAVPTVQNQTSDAETADASGMTTGKSSLYDLQLLDIPADKIPPPVSGAESDSESAAYQALQRLQGGCLPGQQSETPHRRLPWIIDIFLYPANKAGLSVLFICIGVPFILRMLVRFFFFAMASFGPLFIFWVLFIILHWGAFVMAMLYANWYFCECIRDSADGAIRATDTTASTPGFGEIFGQAIKVILSVLVCMAPALIYLNHSRSADGVFRILYAAGGFLIPMAVLAMAMYDALRGLNPVLLFGSILRVPFQYCALVTFGYISCLLVPMTGDYLMTPETWILGSGLLFVTLYQLLIFAHLLGRFYWRNDAKLNWDA